MSINHCIIWFIDKINKEPWLSMLIPLSFDLTGVDYSDHCRLSHCLDEWTFNLHGLTNCLTNLSHLSHQANNSNNKEKSPKLVSVLVAKFATAKNSKKFVIAIPILGLPLVSLLLYPNIISTRPPVFTQSSNILTNSLLNYIFSRHFVWRLLSLLLHVCLLSTSISRKAAWST